MDGGSWYSTEGSGQYHPQEKTAEKSLYEEALKLAEKIKKKKNVKGKGEKDIPIWIQNSKE